jgi:predicted P-loop ATPase
MVNCNVNAQIPLRYAAEFQGAIAFNELTHQISILKPLPWTHEEFWKDNDDFSYGMWLERNSIRASSRIIYSAVMSIALENSFHPIGDYLNGLVWDGDRRIDTWLTDYAGVEPSNYSAAVAAKWLIAGVARIFQPGCKVDNLIILEGPQNLGKSLLLQRLARKTDWYTDDIHDLSTRDAAMQAQGKWIVEFAELAAMAKGDVERIKAFITRQEDYFRAPYARHVEKYPRRCIFSASTNEKNYFLDMTGNRRYWPVACTKALPLELEKVADQLWAEAVVRYREGVPWWLQDDLQQTDASEEAENRMVPEPWIEDIERFTADKELVSINDILQSPACLDIPKERCNPGISRRAAQILQKIGWERFRVNPLPDGSRPWRYRRRFVNS